jgi:hypothetical protein
VYFVNVQGICNLQGMLPELRVERESCIVNFNFPYNEQISRLERA